MPSKRIEDRINLRFIAKSLTVLMNVDIGSFIFYVLPLFTHFSLMLCFLILNLEEDTVCAVNVRPIASAYPWCRRRKNSRAYLWL